MHADKSVDHSSTSKKQALQQWAFRWYLAGTLLVGVGAGLFAGMSASPVVAVLLPLLFALLGGAAGLYLAGVDLADPLAQEKLRLLGIVVTTLMAALIPSTLYGVLVRTGADLRSLVPGSTAAQRELEIAPGTDPVQPLELLLLRKRLQLIGATEAEQENVVALAQTASARVATTEGLSALFRRLAASAKQARDLFAEDLMERTKDEQQLRAAQELFTFVRRVAPQYEFSANYLTSGHHVPISSVQKKAL